MKNNRQNAILQIIKTTEVETQVQLIEELAKIGIVSTQATVSRDIKALNLTKELKNGGVYKYVLNSNPDTQNYSSRLKVVFKENVTSYTNAQNIVVIKTLPGLAPTVCSAIDAVGVNCVVGSVAGNDTGFLAMKDTETAEQFCKEIEGLIK